MRRHSGRGCGSDRIGTLVQKAAQYRQHAETCLQLARQVDQPAQRDALLQMAETGRKLAEEREQLLDRDPKVDGPKPPASAPAGYRARCDFRLAILPWPSRDNGAVAVALVWVIRPAARMNQTASVFVLLVERRRSTACRTGPNFIGGVLTSAWHSRPAQQIPIRKGCLSRWRKRGSSSRATPKNG